ncbi:DNA fragmentation factor subunit alpha-like [Paramuricea clavata]|uniref:DNAation factor subunit alpha-like n=1 Tax=Paramuricea clavata TaxID=317549 RepID=A0A6S7LAM7_PARCT|nr:DNA fragmentation factor subunit alpha-like [Paramuricea clavata]
MAETAKMKPFKVWSANRSKKVIVVANSLEELTRKGNEKIGLNPVNVGDLKLVLEEDGTEVDQMLMLMLLSTNELWSDRKGKLLKKAKETVISQGYEFVKGKSRARSLSDMDSGKESKRKKTDKDERAKEIQNTSDILKNIQEQIEIKQLRLQKQKSLNNFSKCDQIVGEIGKLMNEKKILEKQLKHMEKKEAKSKWYYNKKGSEKRKSGESKQKGKRKSFDIAKMFKNASDISEHTLTSTSDSNESFDTLIVSSDETEGGIEAAADIPRLIRTMPTSV